MCTFFVINLLVCAILSIRNVSLETNFLKGNTKFAQIKITATLFVNKRGIIFRVRTDPGKPGKYWNLIIRIPDLEYTGISAKVLENTGI